MSLSRKLVAIMFTDIVGYTKLMQKSESVALSIRDRHRAVVEETHNKYRGTIIQYSGDGTLSIFESVSDCVRGAIEIQEELQDSPHVPLRIGIHLGDVIITDSDIIGDSVNLASRVESLGIAGSVLISDKVFEEIKNQDIAVTSMGQYHFKNDAHPRGIYAISVSNLKVPDPSQLSGKLELAKSGASDPSKRLIPKKDEELESADDRFEQSVRKTIEEHLSEQVLSVEFLCKKVGYSRPQLYRKLQALTGHSPSELIRELRLKKAAQLLKNNTGNVSEIAYQTGFNNLSYFSKAFQERFGSTPSDYAKIKKESFGLPVSLTAFIGREKELADIHEMLESSRLITLTGTGGTGKTRLALEVLNKKIDTVADKSYFVQLAPISDSEQVLPKIAQILRVQQDPTKSTRDLVIEFIGDRKLLLVLDNFEHVVDAASDISQLLISCPYLKILTTSRTVLNLTGEKEYAVPQLIVPLKTRDYTLEELVQVPSVQLFVQRAKSVKSAFELDESNYTFITEICRNLDGLPLGIELAAARMKIFSPEALVKRLAKNFDILKSNSPDQADRHRSLRNAIDWSYSLLAPEEQTLFRRLSVFHGGWTIDAAEEVCFHSYSAQFDIIDVLTGLVDKSLIYREDQSDGEPRFHMLESIRSFGQERLEKSLDKKPLMTRYAAYFEEKFRSGKGNITGSDANQWLEFIDLELDNLRAVLKWLESEKYAERGMSFALSWWRYWTIRTMMREGSQWIKRMLDIPTQNKESINRCKALNAYGVLFGLTQKIFNAESIIRESLLLARSMNYTEGIAHGLKYLGWILTYQGKFESATKYSNEALAIYQDLGKDRDIAAVFNNLAHAAKLKGLIPRALQHQKEAIKIMKNIGDQRGYAYNLCGASWLNCYMGLYDESTHMTSTALDILEEIDDKQLVAFCHSLRAFQLSYTKSYEQSSSLIQIARPLWQKSGNQYGDMYCDIIELMNLLNLEQETADDSFSVLYGDTISSTYGEFYNWKKQLWLRKLIQQDRLDEANDFARETTADIIKSEIHFNLPDQLEILAYLLYNRKLYTEGVLSFAHAHKMRETTMIIVPPIWFDFHNNTLTKLQNALPEKAYEISWSHGLNSGTDTILKILSSL